jgi:hypothetical protein
VLSQLVVLPLFQEDPLKLMLKGGFEDKIHGRHIRIGDRQKAGEITAGLGDWDGSSDTGRSGCSFLHQNPQLLGKVRLAAPCGTGSDLESH